MSMNTTPHGEFEDALGAYAIGALDADEKRTFEAHLSTCVSCQTELRTMRQVVAGIGLATEPVTPPDSLKTRVMTHATAQPQRTLPEAEVRSGAKTVPPEVFRAKRSWAASPLALAASLALALGAGIYALSLRTQVRLLQDLVTQASAQARSLRDELQQARRDGSALRTTIRVLTAPDLIRVALKGQTDAPKASAVGFWSRAQGLVFNAEGLPAIDVSLVYQLWIIRDGKPESAGLISVDANGNSLHTISANLAPNPPEGLAVSRERAGGVTQPVGPIVLHGTAPK